MTLQRIMFINYSDEPITITVKVYENVGVFEMQPEGEEIEELIDTQTLPQNQAYVEWGLQLSAGGIFGIGVNAGADYTNPDEEHVTILTASGKNPWPPPPPPPPLFERSTDFEDRYDGFLMGLAGERDVAA